MWRVESREGGIRRELLLGNEQECRAEFDQYAAKLKTGSLQLYRPGFGVPVEQVTKPSFLPSVEIPEDCPPGGELPPLKVKRPDPELIKKYFPVEGIPMEEQMEADARRIETMKALGAVRSPAASAPTPSVTGAPDLVRDLAIVDESLRSMELAQIVIANHRKALIEKLASDQSVESCKNIIASAIDSLRRLQ